MSARYVVRLDDACPTMDPARWSAIEALLDRLAIRPIVGVVPDNRDEDLVRAPPDPQFWDHVRRWQAKGWTIAMHGLHHLLRPVDRRNLIVPMHDRSEFGGDSEAAQRERIALAWAGFAARGIRPDAWIAPAHGFDAATLRALREETPIRLVSDGLSPFPFEQEGMMLVPQQLWWPRWRPAGVWTVCLHPNRMTTGEMERLERLLSMPFYRRRMTALPDLTLHPRRRGAIDRAYHHGFLALGRARAALWPAYQAVRRGAARLARI